MAFAEYEEYECLTAQEEPCGCFKLLKRPPEQNNTGLKGPQCTGHGEQPNAGVHSMLAALQQQDFKGKIYLEVPVKLQGCRDRVSKGKQTAGQLSKLSKLLDIVLQEDREEGMLQGRCVAIEIHGTEHGKAGKQAIDAAKEQAVLQQYRWEVHTVHLGTEQQQASNTAECTTQVKTEPATPAAGPSVPTRLANFAAEPSTSERPKRARRQQQQHGRIDWEQEARMALSCFR